MKHYVVYDLATGRILRSGQCPADHVRYQARNADEAALGVDVQVRDESKYRVENDQLVPL